MNSCEFKFHRMQWNHVPAERGHDQLREQRGHSNEDQKHPDQSQSEDHLQLNVIGGPGKGIETIKLHERRNEYHHRDQTQNNLAQPVEHGYSFAFQPDYTTLPKLSQALFGFVSRRCRSTTCNLLKVRDLTNMFGNSNPFLRLPIIRNANKGWRSYEMKLCKSAKVKTVPWPFQRGDHRKTKHDL